jgi:hypothetical protein
MASRMNGQITVIYIEGRNYLLDLLLELVSDFPSPRAVPASLRFRDCFELLVSRVLGAAEMTAGEQR